jgi:hypothetical protein
MLMETAPASGSARPAVCSLALALERTVIVMSA